MNLTLQTVEETVIPTSALAVIVVPVYGGHVAPLAMDVWKVFAVWILLPYWSWFTETVPTRRR